MHDLLGKTKVAMALLALGSSGCSGCRDDKPPAASDAGPASSASAFQPPKVDAQAHAELALAAAPGALVFRDRNMLSGGQRQFAMPASCRQVRQQQVTTLPADASISAASPSRASLRITAPAQGDNPRRSGIMDLGKPGAAPPPFGLPGSEPWLTAHGGRAWRALTTVTEGDGTSPVFWTSELEGAVRAESLGSGDGFRAVDLDCSSERCVLLTTRKGSVLRAGASVWTRPHADEAFARWDIEPTEADADPVPFGIARSEDGVVVAFEHGDKAEFWTLGAGGNQATRTATLPAPGGLAAAIALPTPVALSRNQPLPEKGCRPGLGLTLERPDKPAIPLSAPVQPKMASIRPLAHGALVTWLVPLRCEAGEPSLRRVLYALVIDEMGEPVGSPIPISDTWEYAVATQGDEVDLWLRAINPPDEQAPEITWLRLSCSAAAQ